MAAKQQIRRGGTQWWLYGLAAAGAVVAFFTPWVFLAELSLLVLAVIRLTRRPPRAERIVLTIAVVLLASTLLVFAVSVFVAFTMQGTTSGVSVQVG